MPQFEIKLPEPREIEIPVQRETFEAQVLVVTMPYKRMEDYHLGIDTYLPLRETHRVIASGKYRIELVHSSQVNGKPMLIISEEESA